MELSSFIKNCISYLRKRQFVFGKHIIHWPTNKMNFFLGVEKLILLAIHGKSPNSTFLKNTNKIRYPNYITLRRFPILKGYHKYLLLSSVSQSSLFFKLCCRAKYIPTKAASAKKVKLSISNSLC